MLIYKKHVAPFLRHSMNVIRFFFWPRGSWRRTFRYIMIRMHRMRSSTHAVALGFSVGAFVSFTPFLGFHFLMAALISWILRGNIIASALGTIVGNPLTFPFIWAGDYVIGYWVLHGTLISWNTVAVPNNFEEVAKAFYPLLIGSVPLGLIVAILLYAPVFYVIKTYREAETDDD